MEDRQMRGLQIAATTALKAKGTNWRVPSQVGHGTYIVEPEPDWRIGGYICSCPDFAERSQPCKHIYAVEITIRRESVTEAEDGTVTTVIETATVRTTYGQDWSAYNAAQCAEGDMFGPMLKDLCSTIPNPPQGMGRPRMPRSDMAVNCVNRVYAGLSARRFDSQVRSAKDEGVTECDPHFNTVLRYLRDPEMTPVLTELVALSAAPLAAVETNFAMDSTGFSTSRFDRWYDHKWGKEKSRQQWVKLHAMCGVKTNIITSAEVSDGFSHDAKYLVPAAEITAKTFQMAKVTADKAYSTKAVFAGVGDLGATPFVPYKGGWPSFPEVDMPAIPAESTMFERMKFYFLYKRDWFLNEYHVRSNIETTFSMIKRKFGDSLKSKSMTGQVNEVLCKVIAHNICVLIAAVHEIGLEFPAFSENHRIDAVCV